MEGSIQMAMPRASAPAPTAIENQWPGFAIFSVTITAARWHTGGGHLP